MKEFLKKNKIAISVTLLILFWIVFVVIKSQSGVIIPSGDYDFSLLKNNSNFYNLFMWYSTDYGSFFPLYAVVLFFRSAFKLLSIFLDINMMSNVYYYGTILGLILAGIYLTKKINKKAGLLDLAILSIFSVSNPLVSGNVLGGTNIVYSLVFALIFIGYLFGCVRKESMSNRDVLIIFIILLFFNINILLEGPLIIIALAYFFIFYREALRKNKHKIFVFASIFLLLNLFWVINLAFNYLAYNVGATESVSFDLKNAADVVNAYSYLTTTFSTFTLIPQYIINPSSGLFFYSKPFIILPMFIIVICALGILFLKIRNCAKKEKKIIIFLLAVFLIFFFLSMGTGGPLKKIFLLLWNNVPAFSLYRAPVKFLFINYLAFMVLFIFALKFSGKKMKLVFLIASVFLLSNYFLNPFYNQLTVHFKIPQYYNDLEDNLKDKKLIDAYKVFPDKYFGSTWAYTPFEWSLNNFDTSNILLYYAEKNVAFIPLSKQARDLDNFIKMDLCNEEFKTERNIGHLTKVLGLLNIKHIIMQNDIRYRNSSCFNVIEEYQKESIGKLDLYAIGNNDFLPHFYTPKNIITSKRSIEEIPRILSQDDYDIRSAIFFGSQNPNKNLEFLKEQIAGDDKGNKLPVIEFKKINPTKYRVVVHHASGSFPLVFSESFHEGWKAYLNQNGIRQLADQNQNDNSKSKIDDYKILDGNEDDQASKDELEGYMKNGWITTLGSGKEKTIVHKKWVDTKEKSVVHKREDNMQEKTDYVEKYSIDYVSKNFQGTIQNDNLPNGSIFETWFRSPIDDNKNHLEANGYANSWVIDSANLCANGKSCVKNSDGTYDFEMVVEFWPQRLFYVGLAISGTTLLVCFGYLIYDWRRRKRDRI